MLHANRRCPAAKYPSTKTQVHAIDYSSASSEDYARLGAELAPLDIGVLSAFSIFTLSLWCKAAD